MTKNKQLVTDNTKYVNSFYIAVHTLDWSAEVHGRTQANGQWKGASRMGSIHTIRRVMGQQDD